MTNHVHQRPHPLQTRTEQTTFITNHVHNKPCS